MKIAIVTSDYFVPGETFVNRHIEHMFGGQTCVVCGRANGDDPLGKPLFTRRAPLSPMDRLHLPLAAVTGYLRDRTSRQPFGTGRAALIDFLRAQKTEAILAEFGTQALVVARLANDMGLPVFTYFRGTDASRVLRSSRMVDAYRRMMPRLDAVFSVSQFLLDNLARHGITHPNCHVVPSGVDVRRFAPGTKKPGTFLAVGRMVEKKAPQITLRAFAKAARGRDAQLTFIGDGPLLGPCQSLARDLGVADQVSFAGALPHDAVRERLETTEAFLQHSVTAKNGNTEGLPTAIQEALACGCITLSTRHAGIPEAVDDGVNGYLVAEWDEGGFSERIARLLDTSDRRAMAQAARATAVTRFDNGALLDQVETVIRNAVAARR